MLDVQLKVYGRIMMSIIKKCSILKSVIIIFQMIFLKFFTLPVIECINVIALPKYIITSD